MPLHGILKNSSRSRSDFFEPRKDIRRRYRLGITRPDLLYSTRYLSLPSLIDSRFANFFDAGDQFLGQQESLVLWKGECLPFNFFENFHSSF